MSSRHNNRYELESKSNNVPEESLNKYEIQLDDPAESPPPYYNNESDDEHSKVEAKPNIRESISTEKIGSIMKYLDEVESQAEADMGSVTTASEQMDPLPSPAHSVQSFRSYRSADRSQQCYSDIKGKIVALNVDLNDKMETIEILKQARKKDKEQFEKALAEAEERAQDNLKREANEYEDCLRKQLDRVDTLIQDKSNLAKKCEQLTSRLNQTEKEVEKVVEENSSQWQRKIKQTHEMYKAKKKLWKEEWEEAAKKANNKILAKSLQEQIAQHLENQRQDLIRVRMGHEVEKKKLQDRLQKQHEQELQRQRLEFERRLEKIADENLQTLRKREKELNDERLKQLSEQQERLERESERARDVLYAELKRGKDSHDEEIRRLKKLHERHMLDLKRVAKEERDDLEGRHRVSMERFKDHNSVESEVWIRNTRREIQREMELDKEQLIVKMKRTRDEEIEIIRQKLEKRYREKAKDEHLQHENKTKTQIKAYQAQVQEAHDAEQAIQQKLDRFRQEMESWKVAASKEKDLRENAEDRVDSYRETNQQLTDRLDTIQSQWEERLHERESERQKVIESMKDETNAVEKRVRDLQIQLDEVNENHAKEIAKLKAHQHDALQNVDQRVRSTIEKKDQMIQSLQEELHLTRVKYEQTQTVLDDQRRRLLN